MAQITTLALDGGLRFAPFLQPFIPDPGAARPDVGVVTQLGLSGFSRGAQAFADKPAAGSDTRPDGLFTALGPSAFSIPPRTFAPKSPFTGIVGAVTLLLRPSAALTYGRRRTIVPSVSLSIRPNGGVMVFAHRTSVAGSNRISLAPAATMRFTRSGTARAFSGGSQTTVVPFGFVRVRRRKSIVSSLSISLVPRATLTYAPSVARNYVLHGSSRIALSPSALTAYDAGGIDYAITGSNQISIATSGRISIVRQTTYAIHGSVSLSLRPAATLTKTTGEPQHFGIQGAVTLRLLPQASMGVQVGIINQYFFSGSNRISLSPAAHLQRSPAVPLDPDGAQLEPQPRQRRRLQRVFR